MSNLVKQMPQLKASIIIPCYNCEEFIVETINSILSQSEQSFEILIIDDGSTDDSVKKIRTIPDERIEIITAPHFGGPSKPRNEGLKHAKGKYVFLFDSDDLMLPNKLEKCIDFLDSNPSVDLIFTAFQSIDESGDLLKPNYLSEYETLYNLLPSRSVKHHTFKPNELFEPLLKANFIGTSSVVVRLSLLERAALYFDEEMKNSDDRLLWTQLAQRCTYGFINEALHSYRIREGGISVSGGVKKLENQIIGLSKIILLCSTERQKTIVKRRLDELRKGLIRSHLKSFKLVKAMRAILRNK
jgi:glycosyltransferase involved in cell wall biosynthesis